MWAVKRLLYRNCGKPLSGLCFIQKPLRDWGYGRQRAFSSMDPLDAVKQSWHVLVRQRAGSTLAVKGPELLNKYVGESERAVREIFRKARAASPSIIFFDEIDALGTSRSDSERGDAPSHEGVLTSLLNEMDGVQELVGVTVLAATNRPDVIDLALLRPGRLDRILFVGPPDQQGREEILRIRTKKMSVESGLDISKIATMTDGCSGAEITALCQEAALLTMQKDIHSPHVPQTAFEEASRSIRKQITSDMMKKYHDWNEKYGLKSV